MPGWSRASFLDIHIHDRFVEFLLAGGLAGLAVITGVVGGLLEGELAVLEVLADARVVGGVALPQHSGDR